MNPRERSTRRIRRIRTSLITTGVAGSIGVASVLGLHGVAASTTDTSGTGSSSTGTPSSDTSGTDTSGTDTTGTDQQSSGLVGSSDSSSSSHATTGGS